MIIGIMIIGDLDLDHQRDDLIREAEVTVEQDQEGEDPIPEGKIIFSII